MTEAIVKLKYAAANDRTTGIGIFKELGKVREY
jgi:hypothetical protein